MYPPKVTVMIHSDLPVATVTMEIKGMRGSEVVHLAIMKNLGAGIIPKYKDTYSKLANYSN